MWGVHHRELNILSPPSMCTIPLGRLSAADNTHGMAQRSRPTPLADPLGTPKVSVTAIRICQLHGSLAREFGLVKDQGGRISARRGDNQSRAPAGCRGRHLITCAVLQLTRVLPR